MTRRGTSWLGRWRKAGRKVSGDADALEHSLESAFSIGDLAHQLHLDPEVFVDHAAKVSPFDSGAELDALSAEGLYLAAACVAEVPGASARLEATLFPQLKRTLQKMEGGDTFADEVLQHVRVRLFAKKESSLLMTYSGRGAISGWLKVVAVRDAQRMRKKSSPVQGSDDVLARLPSPAADPELAFLKLRHRQDFKEAFAAALGSLDQRQKNVLQMNLVQGLSIDEVGRVYSVHRATAARWVSAAREQLVSQTRKGLADKLKLDSSELDSLMGAVRTNLSVSLSGLEPQGTSRLK